MQPKIDISERDREGVIKILNTTLADEHLLYIKTRKYHWNVVGVQFNDLHKFFEAQYTQLEEMIDEVAERARSIGGIAMGTLAEFLENARLKEVPGHNPDAKTMIKELLNDHESLIRCLRVDLKKADEDHQDAGTSDFLTGLMEQHEKMAWMLRSFLTD